jgi:sugar lactone lactonase YvrE
MAINAMTRYETTVLLDGLAFPESPRWHGARLWFSDMYGDEVRAVSLDGTVEKILHVPGQPSGLGWLPDGRLLAVSMRDRRLLRLDPAGVTTVADLGHLAPWHCNDMVVAAAGRAYIGNFGFDDTGDAVQPTVLIMVTPDGASRIVAEGLLFPNGMAITPDGGTLIVGESYGRRLSAFSIAADGTLHDRRLWALLGDATADGICLDAEGAVWVASPVSAECLRVREGGEVVARISVETQAIACMLGGPDRRTLFVSTAPLLRREKARRLMRGRIEIARVDVPGAGLP